MAKFTEHGIRLSSMCPSFLNSNSTSHTWPFSAVAELIDNAADPGVFAKQIWIDLHKENDQLCMSFTDNGSGMTPNKLHKMLSFGFTEKGGSRTSVQAIGVYGNGFKSGSMRLGQDALIFTKNGGCQTVGMLSQTYLENIKAQSVIVPIAPFNQQTNSLVVTEDSEASLAAILKHSIISSHEQIQAHFDSILSKKGTKILIWNLRRAKDGKLEIDFENDPSDFRLPEIQIEELKRNMKNSGLLRAEQNIPDMHYSLKAYLSILYLKPRIQIILRGKRIPSKLVSQRLAHIEYDVYKPHFSKDKVKVTFGMSQKNRDHYGIMMYHKNRLIKAYEKVGCQQRIFGQRAGVGVIGIIECDFLKPAHNKQDFEYTKEYRLTLGALGMKLNDYWKEVMEKKARQREFDAVEREEDNEHKEKEDDGPVWLQCEECLKWRSVPAGHYSVIPENWNCSQNPNPRYRNCSSPEETDDTVDLLTASYHKNHKKQEYFKSKKRQTSLKFERQKPKHKSLAHSSLEPTESSDDSSTADQCFTAEVTKEQDQTDIPTDCEAKTAEEAATCALTAERNTVIKDTRGQTTDPSTTDAATQGADAEERENTQETIVESEETCKGDSGSMAMSSNKRKSDVLFCHPEKKRRLMDKQHLSNDKAGDLNSGTRSPEQTRQDSNSQVDKQGDSRPLVREDDSQEARVTKLDELEKEIQRLRQLLGFDIAKKTQGTMTTAICNTENPKEEQEAKATREIGCQAEITENSASSVSMAQVSKLHGAMMQGSRTMCGLKEPEQNKPKKEKSESHSRSSGPEDHNSRMVQDKLHGIRNNVVVLLTALLPQLDMTGISLETTDVDNILQQIIEVNALKL